jgi:Ser/Thr protein kinase RdoA (MazF antagonist)
MFWNTCGSRHVLKLTGNVCPRPRSRRPADPRPFPFALLTLWLYLVVGMQPVPAASATTTSISGSGTTPRQLGQREQFSAEELAVVMSHYDLGIIDSVGEFARGSRKSPKLLVVGEQGKFLLKRRAKGKDDPFKVAFSHAIQLYLASKQFPLPHLVGTRPDNNSMLQWRNNVYEVFEYIAGQSYPHTLEATFESGRVLGLYHKLLLDFRSEWQPPMGSYHRAPSVEAGLRAIPGALSSGTGFGMSALSASGTVQAIAAASGAAVAAGSGASLAAPDGELGAMLQMLRGAYQAAASEVDNEGIDNWPKQIVHADWHPGNMLFRDNHIVAVIDYDAARLQPRILDVANGCLQFSILSGDENVSKWPDYIDESRFKRFLRGYDEVMLLSQAEIRTIPRLMVEALVAEAVLPIAATGTFGRVEGLAFLQMVQRKVVWLQRNAAKLIELAEG